MQIKIAFSGRLKETMAAWQRDLDEAAYRAVKIETRRLWRAMRSQTAGAGLGSRLPRTWRSRVYRNKGLDAAGVVWSKAAKIMRAFEDGVVIKARDGFWLAIPTPDAPRKRGGGRPTPAEVEQRMGIRLRYIARRRGAHLLVADGMVARRGKRGGFRMATERKATKTRGSYVSTEGLTTVVMFWVVPQAQMKKKINFEREIRKAERRLPRTLADQLRD